MRDFLSRLPLYLLLYLLLVLALLYDYQLYAVVKVLLHALQPLLTAFNPAT